MNQINEYLQPLFDYKVLRVTHINPGYDNTNDVYIVVTEKEQFVVKILKDTNVNSSTFWKGLNYLFSATFIDSIKNQKNLSEYLDYFGLIPVPKVLKADWTSLNPLNKPYVILEKMDVIENSK